MECRIFVDRLKSFNTVKNKNMTFVLACKSLSKKAFVLNGKKEGIVNAAKNNKTSKRRTFFFDKLDKKKKVLSILRVNLPIYH